VTNACENNLKEEGVILAHGVRGFSAWSLGSIAFGPEVRQNIMAEGHGGSNCSSIGR
jgi:hypothetical protein